MKMDTLIIKVPIIISPDFKENSIVTPPDIINVIISGHATFSRQLAKFGLRIGEINRKCLFSFHYQIL